MSWKDVKKCAINGNGELSGDMPRLISQKPALINAVDWEFLLTGDVNESLETKYMEIIELCIPKKSLPKWRNLPWLTE